LSLTAKTLLGVALVAAALFLFGLGAAPFVDPPEGFHAAAARDMVRVGDWITPHVDGVRYFDKPPLLYWLIACAFRLRGSGEAVARLGSALPPVGVAVLTAWIGNRLGGPRVGLIAGLVVGANLEVYLFARLVKPDLLFVLCITLAFAGFVAAYLERGGAPRAPWALLAFYAGLAASVLAKDVLGAAAPIAVLAVFFALTRERAIVRRWVPWTGVLLFVVIAAPWYLLVELRSPGFLWYTVVDNHILHVFRLRAYPDEDVPLGALEFLAVTAAGFLPWALAVPAALWCRARGPWDTAEKRVWLLLTLWVVGVIGAVALSPFKLTHYGLPAFPALALLVAKLWDEVLDGKPGAPSAASVLVPPLLVLGAATIATVLMWQGRIAMPEEVLTSAEVTSRNARGAVGGMAFLSAAQAGFALPLGGDGARAGRPGRRPGAGPAAAGDRAGRAARRDARLPTHQRRGFRAVRAQPVGAGRGAGRGAPSGAQRRARPRGPFGEQRGLADGAGPAGEGRGRVHVQPRLRRHVPRGAGYLLERRPARVGVEGGAAGLPHDREAARCQRGPAALAGLGAPAPGGWRKVALL
jgi:4-amino-4-deoxy-L-arabinose transferase-like glycosyltransferase